jgi:hypothetical protein
MTKKQYPEQIDLTQIDDSFVPNPMQRNTTAVILLAGNL